MSRDCVLHATRLLALVIVSALIIQGCAKTQVTDAQDIGQALPLQPVATQDMPKPPKIINYQQMTLTNLDLNHQGSKLRIKPGKKIEASLDYSFHCASCGQNSTNQIIIGLANRSAQACIYNGGPQGQGSANFELKVPAKPGKYEVRFRAVQAVDCAAALKAGWGANNSPPKMTTIGLIIASKKADA